MLACLVKGGGGNFQEILWGVNHEKHHMDEREIVAEHLTGKCPPGVRRQAVCRRQTLEIGRIHFGRAA